MDLIALLATKRGAPEQRKLVLCRALTPTCSSLWTEQQSAETVDGVSLAATQLGVHMLFDYGIGGAGAQGARRNLLPVRYLRSRR